MFRHAILILAIVCFVGATSDDALELCNRLCEKKYDLSSEDACLGGCRKGPAKFLKSDAQGGCQDWCSSAHPNDKTLADACLDGCNTYTPKEENVSTSDNNSTTHYGWLDHLKHLAEITRGFFHRMMRRIGMPCAQETTPAPVTESSPNVRLVVIRRFHIRWPFGNADEEPEGPMMNAEMHRAMMGGGPMPREMMMHGRGMMMSDPDVPVMPFGDDQNEVPRSLNFDDNLPVPHMMPRMIAVRMQEPTWTERMGYGLRYVGSHPLVLLFSVTLIALCILFLVQLVVECRRRHRRNNPFQYNQFDQLPTYVEATMIKVPCDDDYGSDMVKEKSVKA